MRYIFFLVLSFQSATLSAAAYFDTPVEIPRNMTKQLQEVADATWQPQMLQSLEWIRAAALHKDYKEMVHESDPHAVLLMAVNSDTREDFFRSLANDDTALLYKKTILREYLEDENSQEFNNGILAAVQGLVDGHLPEARESVSDFVERALSSQSITSPTSRMRALSSPDPVGCSSAIRGLPKPESFPVEITYSIVSSPVRVVRFADYTEDYSDCGGTDKPFRPAIAFRSGAFGGAASSTGCQLR